MSRMIAWCLIATTVLLMAIQTTLYLPQLPAKMASHFDGAGNPNGWVSTTTFFMGYFLFQIAMVAGMVGLARLIPYLPPELINIPRKDIWLTEQNRQAFYQLNETTLTWVAAISVALLTFCFQLTILANLAAGQFNTVASFSALAVYLLVLGFILVRFFRRLNLVPEKMASK